MNCKIKLQPGTEYINLPPVSKVLSTSLDHFFQTKRGVITYNGFGVEIKRLPSPLFPCIVDFFLYSSYCIIGFSNRMVYIVDTLEKELVDKIKMNHVFHSINLTSDSKICFTGSHTISTWNPKTLAPPKSIALTHKVDFLRKTRTGFFGFERNKKLLVFDSESFRFRNEISPFTKPDQLCISNNGKLVLFIYYVGSRTRMDVYETLYNTLLDSTVSEHKIDHLTPIEQSLFLASSNESVFLINPFRLNSYQLLIKVAEPPIFLGGSPHNVFFIQIGTILFEYSLNFVDELQCPTPVSFSDHSKNKEYKDQLPFIKEKLLRVLDFIILRYESKIFLNPLYINPQRYENDFKLDAATSFSTLKKSFIDIGFLTPESLTEIDAYYEEQIQVFFERRTKLSEKLLYSQD